MQIEVFLQNRLRTMGIRQCYYSLQSWAICRTATNKICNISSREGVPISKDRHTSQSLSSYLDLHKNRALEIQLEQQQSLKQTSKLFQVVNYAVSTFLPPKVETEVDLRGKLWEKVVFQYYSELTNPVVILYTTRAITVLFRLSHTTITKCHTLSGLDSRCLFSHGSQVLGVYEGVSMVGFWLATQRCLNSCCPLNSCLSV